MGDFTYKPTQRDLFVDAACQMRMTWERAQEVYDDGLVDVDAVLEALRTIESGEL